MAGVTQQNSALAEENAATAKTPDCTRALWTGAPTAAASPEPEQKLALLRAARAVA